MRAQPQLTALWDPGIEEEGPVAHSQAGAKSRQIDLSDSKAGLPPATLWVLSGPPLLKLLSTFLPLSLSTSLGVVFICSPLLDTHAHSANFRGKNTVTC